jgi:RHS repeat-associated protein
VPTQVVRSGATSSTATYTYDANDRLTGVCFQAGTCPGGADPFIRWTYDRVGNRLTEARSSGTTSYTYNAADELSAAGATTYTYDQNGNEKSAGSTTFTYDLANRLASTTGGGTTTTYSYDGDGNRRQASTGSQASKKTNFLWDVNGSLPQLALERDGNNALLRRYLYGQRRISMTTGGSAYYYHYDNLGSVANVTSATGASEWTEAYEPFGSIRTETKNDPNAPSNLMKFTGEYLDPTGLYYLRARQYDPTPGRFLGIDPVASSPGDPYVSDYAYVANRPTVLIDPTGESREAAGPITCLTNYSGSPAEGVADARPCGATPCPIRPGYPLGRYGILNGRPGQGTHAWNSSHSNWEDANAIDLNVPVGTRVCAIFKGVIGPQIGPLTNAGNNPRLLRLRLHLVGSTNEAYYAHLSAIIVRAGESVEQDQLLGYSGSAAGVPHLHLALRRGDPTAICESIVSRECR